MLGSDGELDANESRFIDFVAENPADVQLAMAQSVFLTDSRILAAEVETAETLEKYHPTLKLAVWFMPEKVLKFKSKVYADDVSFTTSFISDRSATGSSLGIKEKKVLDYTQTRIFDNPAFWSAYSKDEVVVTKGAVSGNEKQVLLRYDAKKWPVSSWQAFLAMMLHYDPLNGAAERRYSEGDTRYDPEGAQEDEDNLDHILDALGVYPGQCVYCYGRKWDPKKTEGPDSYIGYVDLVFSEGNIHREHLKAFMHLVWTDGEELLARRLRDNRPEELRLLFSRDVSATRVNSASWTMSYLDRNLDFLGTYYRWLRVERNYCIMIYYPPPCVRIGGVPAATDTNVRFNVPTTVLSVARTVALGWVPGWPQPLIAAAQEDLRVPLHVPARLIQGDLGTIEVDFGVYATLFTAALRSIGISADGTVSESELGLVVFNGRKWYYDGTQIRSSLIRRFPWNLNEMCKIFEYSESLTNPGDRVEGSLCGS